MLPLVLGISDGILTALALAAGAILHQAGGRLSLAFACRVGAAACVTAAFTMFVAYYAEARSHLVRASRELNLTGPGRLVASNLGREILTDTAFATVITGAASFIGAVIPLLLGSLLPTPPWVTLAITIGLLGIVGWVLGAALSGHRVRWLIAMLIGGTAVAVIGAILDIA